MLIYLIIKKNKINKLLKQKPIKKYYEELKKKDTYFPIEKISPNLITVVIALEDNNFYKHKGIDLIKTLHALISNIISLRIAAGGSSITQQLAKNMYFSFDKKISLFTPYCSYWPGIGRSAFDVCRASNQGQGG